MQKNKSFYRNFIRMAPFVSLGLFILSITAIVLISCGNGRASEPIRDSKDGIRFFEGSFEQAKIKAADSGKLLFVMLHATWCPACKKMRRNVLPEKKVGDVFNVTYINAGIDYDSDEGKKFRNNYPVHGTPSLFIMSADGKIVRQHTGFMNEEQLIEFGNGNKKE